MCLEKCLKPPLSLSFKNLLSLNLYEFKSDWLANVYTDLLELEGILLKIWKLYFLILAITKCDTIFKLSESFWAIFKHLKMFDFL